ncbi:HEAT repeat domain-containing protein [Laspinema palackyanum]|uniref:HEAT repeat domain-containing protein n=1 Tax=Laspinema palackyanum TaxID=3231601 RepID=UPI00345DF10A|nr:HEAT repeat domain-containing protein [Laspinema sp. D2c]
MNGCGIDEIRSSMVKIFDEEKQSLKGSGFMIRADGYFITCHHVIYRLNTLEVEYQDKRYPAQWCGELSNPEVDIAILKIEVENAQAVRVINPANLSTGVMVYGFPRDPQRNFPDGFDVSASDIRQSAPLNIVSTYPKHQPDGNNPWNVLPQAKSSFLSYRLNAKVEAGTSGGPVFSPELGGVVGVIQGSDENDESDDSYVIRWDNLTAQLAALGLEPRQNAICRFLEAIETQFQELRMFHTQEKIVLKDQYIPIEVTLERRDLHQVETTWGYAESEEEQKRAYGLKGMEEESRRVQVPWEEAKTKHQEAKTKPLRIIVLADPGMGKSTLLKMEAFSQARQERQKLREHQSIDRVVFPLFLCLSKLQDIDAEIIEAIPQLIQQDYPKKRWQEIETFLRKKLELGQCLLLLDALDEVPIKARNCLGEKLGRLARNYPGPLIVTSRIVGYDGRFVPDAKEVEIVPFNQRQLERYIQTWFVNAAGYIQDEAVSASSLIEELKRKPQIQGLAQNPLLLSLICSLYQSKKLTFPTRRVQLYEQAVECMLKEWRGNRDLQRRGKILAKIRCLETLAYGFSCQGQEIFDEDELYEAIETYLQGENAVRDFQNYPTEELMAELSEEDGIIQKLTRDGKNYLFLHRTFQEYFTAAYLKRVMARDLQQGMALVRAHFWEYDWHETLTLLAGLLKNPVPLLEAIAQEKDDIFGSLLLLAGRCLAECQNLSHPVREAICDRLYQLWHRYPSLNFISSTVVTLGENNLQMSQKLQNACISDSDSDVRRGAALVLGKIGTPEVVPALIATLRGSDSDIRGYAAFVLGDIGTPEAVTGLIDALWDSNSTNYIRWSTVRALEKIGSPDVVSALIDALSHSDSDVRSDAASALEKIGTPEVVTALIDALSHSDSDVRIWAALVLKKIGTPETVTALIDALRDSDSDVRIWAALLLGKIGTPEAVTALIDPLSHSDSDVRICAAIALKKIGTPEALTVLIDALRDSNSDVRNDVGWALRKMDTPEAVPALIPGSSHSDSDVRSDAVEALAKMGTPEAVPALIAALSDSDSDVRSDAVEALAKMGIPEVVTALIATLSHSDSDVRSDAVEALAKMGIPEVVTALIATLSHSDSYVRRYAVLLLGEIGTPEAVTALIDALSHSDSDVRSDAALLLGEIGTPEAVTALIDALSHSDSDVRSDVAKALEKFGTLDTLKQIIGSPTINFYEVEIFELVRILVIRYYQKKVPFIPFYPEVIQCRKLKDC